MISLIKACTGWEFTQQELEEMANNIITLTRRFNAREGATKENDTLPPKFFAEPINEGKNIITREELRILVDDYYRRRGWNDAGNPLFEW